MAIKAFEFRRFREIHDNNNVISVKKHSKFACFSFSPLKNRTFVQIVMIYYRLEDFKNNEG